MSRSTVKILHVLVAVAVAVVAVTVAITLALRGPAVKPVVGLTPQQKVIATAPAPAGTKAQAALPCPPPPGEGAVGACTPKPVQVFGSRTATPKVVPATVDPPVCIPDVSSWQGSVDWNAVKSWQQGRGCHPAGIFKMGEYVADPWAAHNNSELARLGMWRAGYWFLRRTGTVHEGDQIVSAARAYGLKVVVEDDETPEAAGYDGPVTAEIHRLAPDLIVAEYASPGAYPGGTRSSNPAWIAAYGPATPPAAPWGGRIVAFQCSDGIFGCATYVPGIGRDDVSVDYGITSLGVATGPTIAQILGWARARAASIGAYHHGCTSPVLTSGRCGQLAWRVNHYQVLLDPTNKTKVVCFGPHASPKAAVCEIVRPAVATYSRARDSAKRAFVAKHCIPVPPLTGVCKKFDGEEIYFQGRINLMLGSSRLKA